MWTKIRQGRVCLQFFFVNTYDSIKCTQSSPPPLAYIIIIYSKHLLSLPWVHHIQIFNNKKWVLATNSNFLISTYIFATLCFRPLIFQTMNSVRSRSLGLKYQRFTTSGCKYIGIRKFEFEFESKASKAPKMTFILLTITIFCMSFIMEVGLTNQP